MFDLFMSIAVGFIIIVLMITACVIGLHILLILYCAIIENIQIDIPRWESHIQMLALCVMDNVKALAGFL